MNIFVLHEDARIAAQMQCSKHVVKMSIESVQLLSTAFPKEIAPYGHSHFNHPCAKWVRESIENYHWLTIHSAELLCEYTKRYGKTHATQAALLKCLDMKPDLPNVAMTPFVRCIKEPWRTQTLNDDIVTAYRAYYIGDKARFAKWAPRASAPSWWPDRNA